MVILLATLSTCKLFADDVSTDDIFRAWRSRQAQTEQLTCHVAVLANYAAGSQLVPGEQDLMPIASRSSRRVAELQLSGPAKWRIDHQGNQFHRRLGRMLNFDLTRLTNGNQYLLNERGYKEVADWHPKPHVYESPRPFRQELYWNDVTFAPILLHYRPFNSMLCPFDDQSYAVDRKNKTINSIDCVLLRPSSEAPFSVRKYHYWVAPSMGMSIIRIERIVNESTEWQYDVQPINDNGKWRPKSYVIRRMSNDKMLEFSKVSIVKLDVNSPISDDQFKIDP